MNRHVNIHDAKTHLSKYVEEVERGNTVVLCRRNLPVAELRRISNQELEKPRPIGLGKKAYGDLELPESFFEPLPKSLVDAFSGKK